MSGQPGRDWTCNLYLYGNRIICISRRTAISGLVFCPRTRLMISERRAALMLSMAKFTPTELEALAASALPQFDVALSACETHRHQASAVLLDR